MDLETALGLAQGALDAGQPQAAVEFYDVALAQFPNNIDVLEAYAEVLVHHLDQPDRARQLLRHAIRVSPDEGHLKFVNLAQLCEGEEALGFYESAMRVLRSELASTRGKKDREAIKHQMSTVKCAQAELFLTDLCERDDAEDACEAAVNDAEQHWPQNVEVHHLRASLRISQERNHDALISLRRAAELFKQTAEEDLPPYETAVEMGRLMMQTSPDDAFPFLLDVLQMNDTNPYVWFLLGETSRLRGRFPDAARLLRRARIMVAPTNTEALTEIDQAIRILVEEMGGAEAVSRVEHMDEPNPLDYLEDEDDDGDDDDDEDEDAAQHVGAQAASAGEQRVDDS